jgi:hypothetical protein
VIEHIVLLLAWGNVEVAGIGQHACAVWHRGVLHTAIDKQQQQQERRAEEL